MHNEKKEEKNTYKLWLDFDFEITSKWDLNLEKSCRKAFPAQIGTAENLIWAAYQSMVVILASRDIMTLLLLKCPFAYARSVKNSDKKVDSCKCDCPIFHLEGYESQSQYYPDKAILYPE